MTEYVNHRDVSTAEDLADALAVLIEDAGEHPSTIYLKSDPSIADSGSAEEIRLTLEEETLGDGSTVKNIRIARLLRN